MPDTKKKIGILVAIEIDAVYKVFSDVTELSGPSGYKILKTETENAEIYILRCGMGEIASSSGTQYLITKFGVSLIINFGVVGGLTSDMKKQKLCLVSKVVHYKYDCSEFLDLSVGQVEGHDSIFLETDRQLFDSAQAIEKLPSAVCCSGDKFISTAEEKAYLHDTFGGDICDMESAGIVLTCEANGIPCILFKAVSDGLSDGAAGFFAELESASVSCLETANKIIEKL